MDTFSDGKSLPLVDDFYTIQGEGYNFGQAAYFIRIGGCDIGCNWCDSKYSWRVNVDKVVAVDEIIKRASLYPAKAIVVTGGEPLNYDLTYLCQVAKDFGLRRFLETSGSVKLSGEWEWVCISPKRNSPPFPENYQKADELKVIIFDEEDFNWAKECAKNVSEKCRLYVQPEWSRCKTNINKIVDFVKENPEWCLSLQAHKFINIP